MADKEASIPTYSSEVRFGVVMYGGVSLAIYINGVANELYEMASATPRRTLAAAAGATGGTREVYGWLSVLLADDSLLAACRAEVEAGTTLREFFDSRRARLADAPRTRLVVDVISGTSAGGINGLFLAKALANNEPFSLLKDLWVHEGDIGKLLNDEGSREGAKSLPAVPARPASLLNSERMYLKLHEAMAKMSAQRGAEAGTSRCVDELDLFVTTTDIRGATVALRLFDRTVPERRHRQVFRFRYHEGTQRNDFDDANRSFLAYAARCTSSFPFAFEPMTLPAIERGGGTIGDRDAWRKLFVESRGEASDTDPLDRAYGDGGYLDNKPFSHAIKALAQREAEVSVERKLIYIEPSPQHPQEADQALRAAGRQAEPPDPLSNAIAALTTIPRSETIREDLESVLARNRLIERVEHIVGKGERDLELREDSDPYVRAIAQERDQLKRFHEMKLDDMRRFYGDAFMPYRRLRVYMVTDKLAERLAQLWALDPQSDRLYALRALVRVWRDLNFNGDEVDGKPTFNAYLDRYDLRYRLRRLHFLIGRVDALHQLLRKRASGALNDYASLSDLQKVLIDRLERHQVKLRGDTLGAFDLRGALGALVQLRQDFLGAREQVRRAEVQLALIGGTEGAARRQRLNPALLETLDLLLDTGEIQRRLHLPRIAALLPPDVMDRLADLNKLPSTTRALQDRVYRRAHLLYEAMARFEATPLQQALEADLNEMGALTVELVDGTHERRALAIVRERLGRPEWQFVEQAAAAGTKRVAQASVSNTGVPVLDSAEGRLLRRFLATYYLRYDSYDQMALPLYYGSNVGEPAKVEVLRISPEDATSLIDERNDAAGRRKLAGTTLANFGGFLDESWRRNDIMWGRFDGAERLIDALLPQPEDAAVRAALRHQAHLAIVDDELAPTERGQVTGLMMQALRDATAAGGANARQAALLAALNVADGTRQKQVESALSKLFEPEGLLAFVGGQRDVDRRLDPKKSLGHAARAVTVAGRVLEGVTHGKGVEALPRWLARGGLVAQALVAVSMPERPLALLKRHWLTMLYLFTGLIFGLGTLFSVPAMRSAALTTLVLLAVTHLITVGLGDVMRGHTLWKSAATWIALAAVLVLAGAGAWALHRVPLSCLVPQLQCTWPAT